MLETHDGQRLLISATDAKFHAATPWGGLNSSLGEIDGLSLRREPQPIYRLALKDGLASLSVLLQGEVAGPMNSLRLGPIRLAAGVSADFSGR